jgi:hypothetical protein
VAISKCLVAILGCRAHYCQSSASDKELHAVYSCAAAAAASSVVHVSLGYHYVYISIYSY